MSTVPAKRHSVRVDVLVQRIRRIERVIRVERSRYSARLVSISTTGGLRCSSLDGVRGGCQLTRTHRQDVSTSSEVD